MQVGEDVQRERRGILRLVDDILIFFDIILYTFAFDNDSVIVTAESRQYIPKKILT